MTNYAKSDKGYKKIDIDTKAIKRAHDKRKKAETPTSVTLPIEIVAELKAIAQQKGLPYQTLMRMLIVEGLENLRKSA